MDITLHDKGAAFRDMHLRREILILPNPWDVGTSRLLEHLGFEALATTSAGFAHSMGRPDGAVDRTTALGHAAAIAACTALPVSADLENCFADNPAGVKATIAAAIETGIVGCSIEDAPVAPKNRSMNSDSRWSGPPVALNEIFGTGATELGLGTAQGVTEHG